MIDETADYLPSQFEPIDLLLALGETPGVAQLIPDIVKMTGARSVIAPIDRKESLPPGLVTQLQAWLSQMGVAVVFPKPFCSLTPETYNRPPILARYTDPLIRQFALSFGSPRFLMTLDSERRVSLVMVARDTACGCARAVARGLAGCSVAEAEYEAGMLHHHYPCLAGMNQDADYGDTLMHVSGHILRQEIKQEIADYLGPPLYLRPAGRVEGEADPAEPEP